MTIASIASMNAASQTGQARTTLSDNFDTFLKLLTAQLANQDPLDPLDSDKFTEQLVAYSQVEQQIRTNEQLEGLLMQNQSAAVSYLGKTARIETTRAVHSGQGAEWSYSFREPVERVRLSVRDSAGREVFATEGKTGTGEMSFAWNGLDANGRSAANGNYRLVVQAVNSNGGVVSAQVSTELRIQGVSFNAGGPIFQTASGDVEFDAIRSIRD
jgi:flagellar basal-body rod modification protein FlgD